MLKEDLKLELPVKLEEILKYTFNFDNLIKIITFLHNNDINLVSDLKDFDKRISILESLKNDIEEIKIKAKNIQNTNENLNRSIQNMQERFLKADYKINEMEKKASENKSALEEQEKIMEVHTQNIDHLNKVVEDNIKKTNVLKEDLEGNKKHILLIDDKIKELNQKDKDLETLTQTNNQLLNERIDEHKNEIEKINNNIIELNSMHKNLKNELDIKNKEFESNISNIINHISSGKVTDFKEIKNKKINNIIQSENDDNRGLLIKTINDNILINSKIAQIENEQLIFKEFIAKSKSEKDIYKNIIEKNSNELYNLQNEINNIKNDIELFLNDNNDNKNQKKIGNIDLSNYATNDIVKKLSDNIRILTSSFGTTPSRDEFETTIRKINSRLEIIELIQQGVTSGPRTMINSELVQKEGGIKTAYITQTQKVLLPLKEEGGNEKFIEEIKNLIITTIHEEIKNISFLDNPKFSEIFENIKKCEEEISKNDSSIINIREILAEMPSQNDLIIIKQDIERLSDESKKKFNELIKIINGDDGDESDDEYEKDNGLAGYSLKKKTNLLIGKYHELFNKINLVQNKSNALSKEIKEEVKQNLKSETLKVVEDFKLKLENFSTKFEIELRNKIDRGGLNIFEDKLNSKLKIDLKEKLDRIELKRNNNAIKRKIDSLENKISKTLVDTIIDLQMDEAPLIIKKNSKNYELCASCNQPVKKDNYLNTDRNFYIKNKSNNITTVGSRNSFRNNNSNKILNMNQTNTNFNSKKLPGILSYTQSK